MLDDDFHLSDQQMLQAADGELDPAQMTAVSAHLAGCWSCRTRSRRIEDAIAMFLQAHQQTLDGRIPPGDGPRALLKARLAELSAGNLPSARDRVLGFLGLPVRPRAWVAGALMAAVAALLLVLVSRETQWGGVAELRARLHPDNNLTPGSTVLRSRDAVCEERPETDAPGVPREVALRVFEAYGISDPEPFAYELDYLIAPELGGSTDVRNLWPQPYSGVWNAHLKDALEDRLHFLVCDGQLDLPTAQRDIATDWIAAYKKYFRTDMPIELHATFRKDHPWR